MSVNLRDKVSKIRDKHINSSYKLIKLYPGSPRINEVIKAQQHPEYMNSLLWVGQVYKLLYYRLNTTDVVNWPEYWKKIN